MRPLRLLLLTALLAAPGCIVVTCGTTRTFGGEERSQQVTSPAPGDSGRGSESRW